MYIKYTYLSKNIYTNITHTYMSSIHLLVTIYISRMMYTYIIHSIIYIKFLRSLCSLGVVFLLRIKTGSAFASSPGFPPGVQRSDFIGYQPKLHALLLVGENHPPPTLLQPLRSEHLVGGKTVMHCSCKAHHEERTASCAINYKRNPSKVPATF